MYYVSSHLQIFSLYAMLKVDTKTQIVTLRKQKSAKVRPTQEQQIDNIMQTAAQLK